MAGPKRLLSLIAAFALTTSRYAAALSAAEDVTSEELAPLRLDGDGSWVVRRSLPTAADVSLRNDDHIIYGNPKGMGSHACAYQEQMKLTTN